MLGEPELFAAIVEAEKQHVRAVTRGRADDGSAVT
jgi:hypothetical protein